MSAIGESLRLHLILPLSEKMLGTCASKWYKQIVSMQTMTSEEVHDWQVEHLRSFVKHAYEHTVYYRNLFDSLGLAPDDIKKPEDLKKLPVMTKEIANAHFDEIIPDNLSQIKCRLGKTGGTTGEPMKYYCDENVWGYVTATKIFHWKKTGYRYGDAFVALGSSSLFAKKPSLVRRIYDKIRNEVPMNSVNLTDELCEKYVQQIKKRKIRYIYGYAASIYILTKYVAKNNIDLTQIEAVFTTSENLTDAYRDLMEKTYKCRVMDCYGARDAGITAYEMARGSYHVGYNAIVEVVNEIAPNTGMVLTTNFLNYSFPLIRYQFGDEAELAVDVKENEYNGQVIRKVIGRTSDVMRLGNGHSLTATGFSMIMKEFDVVAFDISKIGETEVTLRIQPIEGKYDMEQEEVIRKTIRRYVGDDCKLNIEYVDYFEPLKNGKRRYFMN